MNRFRIWVSFFIFSTACCTAPSAVADEPTASNWTRFRGENGLGIVAGCSVNLPWQVSDVRWEVNLPGKGDGSPIVTGNRVFLMSADADTAERYLLAFDLKTGNEVWRKRFASSPHHLHARSSYASSTPCANETAVFFTWATPENVTLVALTHDGDLMWGGQKDLGPFSSQHGYGASPMLVGKKLILFNSQAAVELPPGVQPGMSRVTAFDSQTGEILWETPRTTTRACYGVPTAFMDESGEEALLFSNTGDGLFALSVNTGKPLWSRKVFVKRCVSSPIIVGDLAIGTEGSGGGGNILYGVELTGNHEVKMKVDRSAPYVPTPVAKGNLLFMWGDSGIVSCVRVPSGNVVWSKRIGGNVSTSPVIAGDKLIGISEDGTVSILSASEKYHFWGSVKIEDAVHATPVLSEDYVLIRSDSRLICLGNP